MKSKLPILCVLATALTMQSASSLAFGIAAQGVFSTYGQPVHETITQNAVLASGLLNANQTQEMKHLIEGVRFNDDPEGFLLEGTKFDGKGVAAFALKFLGGKGKKEDPTKASHFGNYQFLHAMGNSDMNAEEIKEKIILYIYHCWRMATEVDSLAKFNADYEKVLLQENQKDPNFKYTRDQIIVRRAAMLFPKEVLSFHASNQLQFQYRALGSLLHVIQDSYSKGHVVRHGWQEGSNSGKILYFQNYGEQDSHEHGALDNHKSGKTNNSNFFEIPGTEIAFERSKQVMMKIVQQCPWVSAGLAASPSCERSFFNFLDQEIFAFDENTGLDARGTHSHPDLVPKPSPPTDPYPSGGG
ncbi:MAG: hypothetical protein ABL930_12510 [Pseudobdellovibrio sp.]